MGRTRTRSRIDPNQPDLVAYAREKGFSVQHTHQIPGALDLIVGFRGVDQRVEIKDPSRFPSERRLTRSEQRIFGEWRGRTPVIWETEEDVDKTYDNILLEVPQTWNPMPN